MALCLSSLIYSKTTQQIERTRKPQGQTGQDPSETGNEQGNHGKVNRTHSSPAEQLRYRVLVVRGCVYKFYVARYPTG